MPSVSQTAACPADPAEFKLGQADFFGNKNRITQAVCNVIIARRTIEHKDAVIVLVNRRFATMMNACIAGAVSFDSNRGWASQWRQFKKSHGIIFRRVNTFLGVNIVSNDLRVDMRQ